MAVEFDCACGDYGADGYHYLNYMKIQKVVGISTGGGPKNGGGPTGTVGIDVIGIRGPGGGIITLPGRRGHGLLRKRSKLRRLFNDDIGWSLLRSRRQRVLLRR